MKQYRVVTLKKTHSMMWTEPYSNTVYESLDEASEEYDAAELHAAEWLAETLEYDRDAYYMVCVEPVVDDSTEDHEEYTPSVTAGDYSPGNPCDAPGMSVSDFI